MQRFDNYIIENGRSRITHPSPCTLNYHISPCSAPTQGPLDIHLYTRCKNRRNHRTMYIGFEVWKTRKDPDQKEAHPEPSWSADMAYTIRFDIKGQNERSIVLWGKGRHVGYSNSMRSKEFPWLPCSMYEVAVVAMQLHFEVEYQLLKYPQFTEPRSDANVELRFDDGCVMHLNNEQLGFYNIEIRRLSQDCSSRRAASTPVPHTTNGTPRPVLKYYYINKYSSKAVLDSLHILLFNKPVPSKLDDIQEILEITDILGSKVLRHRIEQHLILNAPKRRQNYAIASRLLFSETYKLTALRWSTTIEMAKDDATIISDSRFLQNHSLARNDDQVFGRMLEQLMEQRLPPAAAGRGPRNYDDSLVRALASDGIGRRYAEHFWETLRAIPFASLWIVAAAASQMAFRN